MESKERLASQKRRVSTPSPMPAKQKRELEALNNIIPVTNIDTGEAVDLKFLEELTEQVRMRMRMKIDDRPLTITSLFDSRFSLRM